MLIIPWEWFLPLLLLVVVLLLLSYKLQQKVLGVAVSPPLLLLSCLTFGISCLAAAAAACCCSVLGALLLQLHGPLYVHWPAAAAWRVAVAFATFLWCWHRTLFSPLASRFPLSRHPLLAQHAARAGPLAMLLPLVLALHRMRLFSCFYLLLLLLGLVGPRVFLLLFWLSRQGEPNPNKRSSNHQTNNHSNERKNSSNQQNVIATKIQRGSALLIADALGAAFPSLLFFQAYLAFLDGVSGPAGRSGEFLLFADVLLNAAVLLPVVLLLPATLSPSLLHLFDYCGRLRAAASPLRPKQLRKRNARWKIKVYFILGAAAALLAAVWLSNVELSIHPREEFPKDIEPSAMEEAAGNWGPWQLLKQPTEWLSFLQHKFQGPLLGAPQGDPQGGLPRSILGFLPMRLRRFLTDVLFFPSGEYPFSFERPLQLHFVSFRRSKVIAKKLLNGGSSSSSKGDKMEAAAAGFRFSPELEQLANTDPSAHLVRHSTQGVAVLGLGSQTFGNPAAQDINKVLSAVRKAVLAAEETAATGGQTPQKASAAGANKNAAEAPGTETAAIRVAPSFLLKEEAPSPNAPLTLAHLHRHSINRTHWSVYTDAQAFLTPKKPTERTRVYSPGIRGEVDIQYDEKTDETKFSLLIGGGSLLVIALPAAGVKGWNLEQQAPLQRLKECDCYMVTIITPAPPVMTKLEFFFHGKVPVRFTTRSGVFDAMAPNWNCSQTLLSRFVQSSFPFEHAAELQQKHSLPVPPSEQNANETSSSGLDGSDAFWERLLASLPPHIAAAGSSADAAEWMLPEAPFKASFVF